MLSCILTQHTDNEVYELSEVHKLKNLSSKTIQIISVLKTMQALSYFSKCWLYKSSNIGVFLFLILYDVKLNTQIIHIYCASWSGLGSVQDGRFSVWN